MKERGSRQIIIAVTETCPVRKLWNTAMQTAGIDKANLTALFLPNRRWQHAASLPFTREFPNVGGKAVNFSLERAHDIDRENQDKVQQKVEQLASAARTTFKFEVLREELFNDAEDAAGGSNHVVIASSYLAERGMLSQFEKLHWQILLVDSTEDTTEIF